MACCAGLLECTGTRFTLGKRWSGFSQRLRTRLKSIKLLTIRLKQTLDGVPAKETTKISCKRRKKAPLLHYKGENSRQGSSTKNLSNRAQFFPIAAGAVYHAFIIWQKFCDVRFAVAGTRKKRTNGKSYLSHEPFDSRRFLRFANGF